jgi:hypothetical protein
MIVKADKSNALVILPIEQYDNKIQDFITANSFKNTTKDPTKCFQTKIRGTINNSNTLIPKNENTPP